MTAAWTTAIQMAPQASWRQYCHTSPSSGPTAGHITNWSVPTLTACGTTICHLQPPLHLCFAPGFYLHRSGAQPACNQDFSLSLRLNRHSPAIPIQDVSEHPWSRAQLLWLRRLLVKPGGDFGYDGRGHLFGNAPPAAMQPAWLVSLRELSVWRSGMQYSAMLVFSDDGICRHGSSMHKCSDLRCCVFASSCSLL